MKTRYNSCSEYALFITDQNQFVVCKAASKFLCIGTKSKFSFETLATYKLLKLINKSSLEVSFAYANSSPHLVSYFLIVYNK